MATMTLNKMLKRLPVLLVLAVLGLGLTGCSMLGKRQTPEYRNTPPSLTPARYEPANR